MKKNTGIRVIEPQPIAKVKAEKQKLGPQIQFVKRANEDTGLSDPNAADAVFSDGSPLFGESVAQTLQNTTGTPEKNYALPIIQHVAGGLQGDCIEAMNRAARMLPIFAPQDETEALLAGQFLALQEAANKYLRRAEEQETFTNFERYLNAANKLFNTANQTMQTLIKYRSGGKQVVQVVHLHNEGQAIVAQNLSHGKGGGGVSGEIEV
jgi:hypothetical protein